LSLDSLTFESNFAICTSLQELTLQNSSFLTQSVIGHIIYPYQQNKESPITSTELIENKGEKNKIYNFGNPSPAFGQAQECCRFNLANCFSTTPSSLDNWIGNGNAYIIQIKIQSSINFTT